MDTGKTTQKVPREAVEKVGEAARKVAGKASAAAAVSSGWKKVLAYAVGIAAAAVAFAASVLLNSCSSVTREQVQAAHSIYHAVSGAPCVLHFSVK